MIASVKASISPTPAKLARLKMSCDERRATHTIGHSTRTIEAFIELMRPYGIMELARTGRIALVRGNPGQGDVL